MTIMDTVIWVVLGQRLAVRLVVIFLDAFAIAVVHTRVRREFVREPTRKSRGGE